MFVKTAVKTHLFFLVRKHKSIYTSNDHYILFLYNEHLL